MDVGSLVSEFPNDNPALHGGVRWVCLEVTGACSAIASERSETETGTVTATVGERETEIGGEAEPLVAHAEAVADAVAEADAEADAEVEAEVEPAPPVLESGIVLASHAEESDEDDEIIVEELEPLGEIEPEAAPLVMVASETLPPPMMIDSDPPAAMESQETASETEAAEAELAGTEPETVLPPPPEDPFTVLVCRLADIAIGAGAPDVAAMLPALLMDGRLSNDVGADTAAALAEAGIVVDGAVTATFAGQTAAWRAILGGTSDDFDATGGAMLDEWAAELLACLLGARSRGPSLKKDLRARGVAAFGLLAAA